MPRKGYTIEQLKDIFNARGYELITDVYKGYKAKYEFICKAGHKNSMRLDHFIEGHNCSLCVGNKRIPFSTIKKSFEKEDYIVVSKGRCHHKDKIEYICDKGHHNSMTWDNWHTGYRCPDCARNKKLTEEFVRNELIKEGYNLLNSYTVCQDTMELECKKGHLYNVSWDNWRNKNSRCPKCNSVGMSKPEKEIIDFLNLYNIEYTSNDRTLINPYELDIVLPIYKIAIEYCGLYWHSENMGKIKDYHLNKLNMCEKIGYRLITVFEDEFIYRKDVVMSRLATILNINLCEVIYGRKCIIEPISSKETRTFCEENHLQGYINSSIRLGAFYKNELVAVMAFSKLNISKGSGNNEGCLELTRFCCKKYTRIIGIASKLLKYFENNYECNKLLSYADRRWSTGNLYNKTGFDYEGFTKPNYWYILGQQRLHRFNLRKKENEPKDVSEYTLRKAQGYNRIWDCGSIRYMKKY